MSLSEDRVRAVVDGFVAPDLGAPLAELGRIAELSLTPEKTRLVLEMGFPTGGYQPALEAALSEALRTAGHGSPLELVLRSNIVAHSVQRGLKPLEAVRNVVAVASGKGGVGKSTVAVNLALAWAAQGARVGMLDADIYGPSQPLMLGLSGQRPTTTDGKRIEPLEAYGIKAMSIGFLVEPDQAVAWRGPMVTQALTQLLSDTDWGELDYLVVDMPPGTGDIQLTLAQRVPVAGSVIVTTPQDIALADARKGVAMFEKVAVPVLGIVENMSVYLCSNCGHAEHVFGSGGGERIAAEFGVPLLGQLPLDARIREEADGGRPTVVAEPQSARAALYFALARRSAAALALRGRDRSAAFPKIVIEKT